MKVFERSAQEMKFFPLSFLRFCVHEVDNKKIAEKSGLMEPANDEQPSAI
jgi:hypothetical protein